jgi:hypothetical protein
MDPAVLVEIEGLQRLKTRALRTKYEEVFGTPSRSSHKQFLVRRIAWRLQARAEGDLSERARRRAAEIADDADLRLSAPRELNPLRRAGGDPATLSRTRYPKDRRLPPAGTVLTRHYRGQPVIVKVLEDGFDYQARQYRSLSAIAREVTGTRWNGLLFFGLTERRHG